MRFPSGRRFMTGRLTPAAIAAADQREAMARMDAYRSGYRDGIGGFPMTWAGRNQWPAYVNGWERGRADRPGPVDP